MNNEVFLKKIGERIRQIREEKGMSLGEFDLENDIDKSFLSKIELGKKSMDVLTLKKIVESLGISWTEFFKEIK